jgi:hypothetical protein
MLRPFVPICLFLIVAGSLSAAPQYGGLQVTLSADALAISGIRPGTELVVFGESLQTERAMLVRRQFMERIADADQDGKHHFKPRGGVPLRSLWVVVDLSTGATAVAIPEQYDGTHEEIAPDALQKGTGEAVLALDASYRGAHLMLVRPGAGAWTLRRSDEDHGYESGVSYRAERSTSLNGSPPAAPSLHELEPGDILASVDLARREVRTFQVSR